MARTTITITFEDGETASRTINILEPQFEDGWWSYDKDGKERYEWGEDEISIPLGKTMYFNVKTKDIVAGEELEMQLMDYDYFWWLGEHIDEYNIDTSKFPNDTVWKKAKVRAVDGQSIATVELLLNESWEPVIADDHDDAFSLDQNIELYWRVRYVTDKGPKVKKILPQKKEDYLRVGYNDRDLYIKPAVDGSSLPEYYDKNGKLIIFAFKRAKDIATGLNPNAAIEKFIVTKIKVVETRTLSEINKVKRELYYERINLNTNDSKRMLYVTEEASEFYIKGTASFTDVTNTEIKNPKKFSEYFNKKDAGDIATVGLKEGREILRFLDYVSVTETLISMFPKEGSTGLEVPKPSSAAGIISTFATGELTWALSGALSALFMVADVIATQEVNKIMNDVREYNFELLQRAKLEGLKTLKAFIKGTRTEALIGFSLIEGIPVSTHCKILNGDIKTFKDLNDSIFDEISNGEEAFYTYLIQTNENEETTERATYLIDSVHHL
ncbi:hypothetical protein ACSTS3_19165 [Aquimarina muelleri]|uniref:hypothetical protein n=1 Tax=Aquimarina muelleri TaxID=279356 RepID=UPI003F6883BB